MQQITSIFVYTVDTAVWKCITESGSSSSSKYIDVYTGANTQTVDSTASVLVLETTRKTSGDCLLSSNEIIASSGTYDISLRVSVGASAQTAISMWLELDNGSGFNEVSGSRAYMYTKGNLSGETTGFVRLIETLSDGDKLRVMVIRIDGTASVSVSNNGTGLTLIEV